MIDLANRQVIVDGHRCSLTNSISILSDFQVEEGCGDHLTFDA